MRALPARARSRYPVLITVAPAEQAQTARVAYCCSEPASGDDVHGSQQDRVFDPQSSCQAVVDRHRSYFLEFDFMSVFACFTT